MITRITLFKLRDGVNASEVAARTELALASLPGLTDLALSLPLDEASAKSWDLCLILRFARQEDHDRALATAAMRELFERELAPRVQVIKAWSFALLQK